MQITMETLCEIRDWHKGQAEILQKAREQCFSEGKTPSSESESLMIRNKIVYIAIDKYIKETFGNADNNKEENLC